MPKIIVRRACDADLDGICEAHMRAIREACATAYTPVEIEAWAGRLFPGIHGDAIRAHEFHVALGGDRVLGFAQMDGATGEVHGCYVHPAALRRGVGTRLLATLETRAVELGLARLHLDASLNAVAFYRARGFTDDGASRHTLAGGVTIACRSMSKRLR